MFYLGAILTLRFYIIFLHFLYASRCFTRTNVFLNTPLNFYMLQFTRFDGRHLWFRMLPALRRFDWLNPWLNLIFNWWSLINAYLVNSSRFCLVHNFLKVWLFVNLRGRNAVILDFSGHRRYSIIVLGRDILVALVYRFAVGIFYQTFWPGIWALLAFLNCLWNGFFIYFSLLSDFKFNANKSIFVFGIFVGLEL